MQQICGQTVQILQTERGEGVKKNPTILWMSYMKAPLRKYSTLERSNITICLMVSVLFELRRSRSFTSATHRGHRQQQHCLPMPNGHPNVLLVPAVQVLGEKNINVNLIAARRVAPFPVSPSPTLLWGSASASRFEPATNNAQQYWVYRISDACSPLSYCIFQYLTDPVLA